MKRFFSILVLGVFLLSNFTHVAEAKMVKGKKKAKKAAVTTPAAVPAK